MDAFLCSFYICVTKVKFHYVSWQQQLNNESSMVKSIDRRRTPIQNEAGAYINHFYMEAYQNI